MQSRDRRTFLIHARRPEGDHDIVGKVNVTDVVRGRFESAAMGLHRIAAAVQPGNVTSAGLLRSLGFQREGYSSRMLWLPGADGNHAWQDHVSYVVTREDWPAEPYASARGQKVVVLVNGPPGSGKRALARRLAAELRIPLFSKDFINESVTDALWQILEGSPVGGVVESWFGHRRRSVRGRGTAALRDGSSDGAGGLVLLGEGPVIGAAAGTRADVCRRHEPGRRPR